MSNLSPVPGITLGDYPERNDPTPSALERCFAKTLEVLKQRKCTTSGGHELFLSAVDAQGDAFRKKTDQQLHAQARDLSQQLRSEGMPAPLIARSFALIREASARTLGLRHFDSQLIGGWVMINGMLAEMETGQGKTLTATLVAGTAAMAGIPVHVITANQYLVARDAEKMSPVYDYLGLRVGVIEESMDADARRSAYAADITYCTGQQLVFDYLKDRMVLRHRSSRKQVKLKALDKSQTQAEKPLLRGLCFAIIDEADSVLIDEARTPLVLSRPAGRPDQVDVVNTALSLAKKLSEGSDYSLHPSLGEVSLTKSGLSKLKRAGDSLGGMWAGPKRREQLIGQALSALHGFKRDIHYLVREGKIQIIDQNTGRAMPDRSWEQGLHQMIESKEGCEITLPNETIAKISYQRFFRRYMKLCGMSGTVSEVARELWSTYAVSVTRVQPNKPIQRTMQPAEVYVTAQRKWQAVVSEVSRQHDNGRPILIGTRSVQVSEHLSGLLEAAGLPHQVLNARQDHAEAEIVACAGELGAITVATNMAGRGTDISLGEEALARGGLHVIATELNDSSRIDRQLFGRCARQGDPGSCAILLSFEDELSEKYIPRWIRAGLSALLRTGRPAPQWLGRFMTTAPQRALERHHKQLRSDLSKMDEHLGRVLAFSGNSE